MTSNVRENYSTETVRFSRSVGLPPRKPLTHCTWFKSRTGPIWGIRRKWTRYQKPDFPKVKFARVGVTKSISHIPHYKPPQDVCNERLVPRKFRLLSHLTESKQVIWMEIEKTPEQKEKQDKRVIKETPKLNNLMPKIVNLTGLKGMELKLARRKMPKRKFLP